MIHIIDDVIPVKYQDEIQNLFFSKEFNWNLRDNLVSNFDNNIGEIGFAHQFYCIKTNIVSEYYQYILPLLYSMTEKSNLKYSNVLNARTYLQTPSPSEKLNDYFHVDVVEQSTKTLIPHTVCLYYVNDSDGDTLISEEIFTNGNPIIIDKSLQIKKSITPKKGRAVIFNGEYYHSAGIPKKHKRCIINFDIM